MSSIPIPEGFSTALYQTEGVAYQGPQQRRIGHPGVDAQPVPGMPVVGRADAVVLLPQLGNAPGLAFEGHMAQVVDVEIAEHVAADVEHQHVAGMLKLAEGEFLFHLRRERQAVFSQFFDIHGQDSKR